MMFSVTNNALENICIFLNSLFFFSADDPWSILIVRSSRSRWKQKEKADKTCKCYITFSSGIKQTDITDNYRDRMKT